MEMFYLYIWLSGSAVIIPEKYTKEQCDNAGKVAVGSYKCIPAPKHTICRSISEGSTSRLVCE